MRRAKPGSPEGGRCLSEGESRARIGEWRIIARVKNEDPLANLSRSDWRVNDASDRSHTKTTLEVIHRAQGRRQVDALTRLAIPGKSLSRRVVRADFDRAWPDEYAARRQMCADTWPNKSRRRWQRLAK